MIKDSLSRPCGTSGLQGQPLEVGWSLSCERPLGSSWRPSWGSQAQLSGTVTRQIKAALRVQKRQLPLLEEKDSKKTVRFSCSVVSDSLRSHGLQHARLPCLSPTPRVYSNSCPSSRWWHPAISSSVVHFSSCLQSSPTSQSFPMSQIFASGGQSIGVSASASVLPMNTQDWSPLGWTGWISLQSKGLSRVFSSTTVQKHQFFGSRLSL